MIVLVAAKGSVVLLPAVLPPPLNLHWSPCQVKEEKLRDWNDTTIPQVNRLEGRPGPSTGKGHQQKCLLEERHPQLPSPDWSASGDLASLFMGKLLKTWRINGGGEVITAHCYRTCRTSERTKQMHRYQMHNCTTNAIQIPPIFKPFLQEVNTGSNYFIQRNKVLSITNKTHSSQLFK